MGRQFDTKWHNLLVITVNSGKVGIPIRVEVLDKTRGVSNMEERKKILKKVIAILGLKCIYTFYADREFIGKDWISYLLKLKIRFFIRLRNNQIIFWNNEKHQISKLIGDKTMTIARELNDKKQPNFILRVKSASN